MLIAIQLLDFSSLYGLVCCLWSIWSISSCVLHRLHFGVTGRIVALKRGLWLNSIAKAVFNALHVVDTKYYMMKQPGLVSNRDHLNLTGSWGQKLWCHLSKACRCKIHRQTLAKCSRFDCCAYKPAHKWPENRWHTHTPRLFWGFYQNLGWLFYTKPHCY